MARSPHPRLSALVLVLACLCNACVRDPVGATADPIALLEHADPQFAALDQEIAGLEFLLAHTNVPQPSNAQGEEPTVTALRRQRMEARVAQLYKQRSEFQQHGISRTFPSMYEEGVEPDQAPGCIDMNTLQADNCFLDWASAIEYSGKGSVYQIAQFYWNHSTSTYVSDNSTLIAVRSTSSFGMQSTWSAPFTFAPADPNCVVKDHIITGATTHQIKLGIKGYGVAMGEESSLAESRCTRKYLTVSLSQVSIEVGQTVSITVGHLPEGGCAYGITSSDSEIASIQNYGGGMWGATGLSAGSVSITAKCPDGSSGSAVLTVTQPTDGCTVSGTTTVESLMASLCGSKTGTPGGDSGDPPPGPNDANCTWYRDVKIYTDGSWEWLGDWFQICDQEFETLRALVASSQPAPEKLRLRLVGTASLGNGRAIIVLRTDEPDVAATIVVDTSRASAADLEHGLAAAQRLSAAPPEKPGIILGTTVTDATDAARAKYGNASRAAGYLNALRSAASEAEARPFGKGRSLEIEIDRKTIRAGNRFPTLPTVP